MCIPMKSFFAGKLDLQRWKSLRGVLSTMFSIPAQGRRDKPLVLRRKLAAFLDTSNEDFERRSQNIVTKLTQLEKRSAMPHLRELP